MVPPRLLAFIATAFVVIVIPGPGALFVVGRALAGGRRVAVLTVLGNAAGECAQVVAIAVGVGTLVKESVAALTTLKLLGGNVSVQILVLGLMFAAIAVASDTLWALAAGAVRSWFAISPRRLELVGATGGVGIVAVGLGCLISGRKG